MKNPKLTKRVLNRDGSFNTARIGIKHRLFNDSYYFALTLSWPKFFAVLISIYFSVNFLFGLGYLLCGEGAVEGLAPGHFQDAFFFSVQTLATIGYGRMAPVSLAAHLLVTLEALFGLLGLALATGLLFSRFSRPTARVVLSRVAVITQQQGVLTLIFRIANERQNQIVDAHVNVVYVFSGRTPEGEQFRTIRDLQLVRNHSPLFAATWTVMHKIDENSPLYKKTKEDFLKDDAEILVSFTGVDDTLNQTVHTRFSYTVDEIAWNHRFVDILAWTPEGIASIDLTKIHDTLPSTKV